MGIPIISVKIIYYFWKRKIYVYLNQAENNHIDFSFYITNSATLGKTKSFQIKMKPLFLSTVALNTDHFQFKLMIQLW